MSNQINQSLPYPSGFIRYAFKMHVTHYTDISCELPYPDKPNVKKLVLEKVKPDDESDPEWHMTIELGPVPSIKEVDKIGNEIKNDIFDLLSFILDTKIYGIRLDGHGLTPRPGEGAIVNLIAPFFEGEGYIKSGCRRLSEEDIREVQDALSKISTFQHKALVSLFRYAISIDEPIVQFLILYLILDAKFGRQAEIDRQIICHEPNTPTLISPHSKEKETIYTKLRNEIAHRVKDSSELTKTREEIINNRDQFKKIVHRILKSCVKTS